MEMRISKMRKSATRNQQIFRASTMALSCGGILCGVGFFVGFMILSEMIDSATDMENDAATTSAFGGVVFTGQYTFSLETGNDPANYRQVLGQCQLRGVSKPVGAADMAVTSIELKLRHDSVESEVSLHSGLLMEKEPNVLEFFGKGETHPFMFPLLDSESSCELDSVKIEFQKPQGSGMMTSVGRVSSEQCKFNIEFNLVQVNLVRLKRKIVHYSILNNAVSLGLIKLFIDQIRILDSSSNFARVAIASVIMQAIADSLDSMLNFFIGLSIQFLFNIFIIISLFKFILFSFFEMRMIILAWRQLHANDINSMDPYDASRIERNWVQLRLYLPLVSCLFLLMVYPGYAMVPIAIISQLYWVPQIIHDAIKGHKSPLTNQFVVGVSLCRVILPLYIWGCPQSIFSGEVIPAPPGGPTVAVVIAILQAIQVGLLLTQKMFGPRWFVPWMCLPNVYNYYRKIDVDEEFGVPECVVCMSEIDLKSDRKETLLTPCGHLFHSQCLGEWMNLRQECPLCRRELPPIT